MTHDKIYNMSLDGDTVGLTPAAEWRFREIGDPSTASNGIHTVADVCQSYPAARRLAAHVVRISSALSGRREATRRELLASLRALRAKNLEPDVSQAKLESILPA